MKIQHTKETVHERSSWSKENAIDRRQLSQWGQVSTAQFRVAENGKLLGYSAACRVVTSLLCLYRCTGLIIRRWSGRFNTSNYGVVVNNTANTAKDILWTQLSKLNNESFSVPNSFQGTQILQIFANLYSFYIYRWTINIFITNYYARNILITHTSHFPIHSYLQIQISTHSASRNASIPLNSLIKRRNPNLRISSNEQSLLSKYLSAIVPSLISRCNLNRQEEDRLESGIERGYLRGGIGQSAWWMDGHKQREDARIKTRLEGPHCLVNRRERRHRLPMCANETPEGSTTARQAARGSLPSPSSTVITSGQLKRAGEGRGRTRNETGV